MIVMKKYFAVCLSALLLAASVSMAQTVSFQTMRMDRDAASEGLAGASVASVSNVAMSAFKNAAAVPFYDGKGDSMLSFSKASPKGGSTSDITAGAGIKFSERFAMSLAFDYHNGIQYQIVDDFGIPGADFKTSAMFGALGFGFKLTDWLSLGVDAKFASETLSPQGGPKAFAGDVFVMYCKEGLSATLGVSTLGGGAQDVSGRTYSTPASATAGIAYVLGQKTASAFELCGDFDYFFNGGVSAAAGARYSFKDMVSVRAGYHFGTDKAPLPSYLALGLGVKFFGVHLDFAYHLANEVLGGTFNVGLGYSF